DRWLKRRPSARQPVYAGEVWNATTTHTSRNRTILNEGRSARRGQRPFFDALRGRPGGRMTATSELQIVQVPIDELHPDPANPRKISDSELDALTRSLREFGFVQPVIARYD